MIGKMSKDIGMGVRKGTVVSFVPTLFGYFLGIPSLYVSSFCFCDLCKGGWCISSNEGHFDMKYSVLWLSDTLKLKIPFRPCIVLSSE